MWAFGDSLVTLFFSLSQEVSGDKRKRELLEGIGWWDGGLGQAGRPSGL